MDEKNERKILPSLLCLMGFSLSTTYKDNSPLEIYSHRDYKACCQSHKVFTNLVFL